MKQHTPKIYKVLDSSSQKRKDPLFSLQDGKLFRTVFHPLGWSEFPDYTLGNDGKFYRTEYHKLGPGKFPDYEFKNDMKLYRTSYHPDGKDKTPEYELLD